MQSEVTARAREAHIPTDSASMSGTRRRADGYASSQAREGQPHTQAPDCQGDTPLAAAPRLCVSARQSLHQHLARAHFSRAHARGGHTHTHAHTHTHTHTHMYTVCVQARHRPTRHSVHAPGRLCGGLRSNRGARTAMIAPERPGPFRPRRLPGGESCLLK